jgi:hypothetical protein
VEGPFIAPQRESSRWAIRDLDISGSGVRHVRSACLETGQGTEYVRSEDLVAEELG